MTIAGSLNYDTKIDTSGFQKGINQLTSSATSGGTKIKNIVAGLGITKIIGSAISAINNSIDGAVSRIDTMNNYPKVMANLGIESEKAEESIKKLSDKLTGLPTTLDSAALSVQRLTSANGDIEKSTDMFLAMNNAILAGGASTEIQTSALEQLSQAYAKGKPDMVEWRSIMTAMPAQLKQVATSMGYVSTDELGEELREGNLSMDAFMDEIIKLNKQGTKGFLSFEKQARNATGGISTSITNMKTAVTRGVANVIDALDKSLKKANLGGLSTQISNLGNVAEKVFKEIASVIEEINWQKVIESLRTIIPLVTSLVAGFISYQTALKAIQAINIAKNIATTVQSIVSLANPVGLAVAGVTALVSGLYLLTKAMNDNDNAILQTKETLKEYNASMKEADESRQKYLDENMNEVGYYQTLSNELNNLSDANGKIKRGYEERAKFIATTLNEALGTEIKIIDGTIQKYDGLEESINSVIEAKRAQVLLEAQEEKYNTAKDKKVKLEETYANILSETTTLEKERSDVLTKIGETYNLTDEQMQKLNETNSIYSLGLQLNSNEMIKLQNELTNVNSDYMQSKALLDETGTAYANNQLIIGNYETALMGLRNKNYDVVLGIYEDTTNYQGKTSEETYNNYQKMIESQKLYLNDLKANKYNYDEEYLEAEKIKTEAVIKNLQQEQSKYKTTVQKGQSDAKNVWNSGLAQQLSTITGKNIEFRKTSDGNIQAYINGVKYGKPKTKQEAKELAETMTNEIKKGKTEAEKAGGYLVDGTTSGINNRNKQNSAFYAISSFGSSLLTTLKNSLKEKSPSKASEEMGEFLIEGLNIGIDNNKKDVYRNIENFGEEILSKMSNAVNIETGKMSFGGTTGSVSQILSANSVIKVENYNTLELDGEKVYENQQTIQKNKNLQYGFGGANNK